MTALTQEEVYCQYRDKVGQYISAKITNRADAEDLVSETFLKVYEKFDTFDESRSSLSTWIYTITRNTVIDYFRKHRIHAELSESLPDEACVEDEIFREEALKLLAQALKRLDRRSRDLIILRYDKKLSLKDIAVRLDISYAYVKILHKDALQRLRAFLNTETVNF